MTVLHGAKSTAELWNKPRTTDASSVHFPRIPDALGRILPARDVVQAFRDLNLATRQGIWAVTQRCEDLSDGVREVRNDYRDVDAEIAATFEALMGAAR